MKNLTIKIEESQQAFLVIDEDQTQADQFNGSVFVVTASLGYHQEKTLIGSRSSCLSSILSDPSLIRMIQKLESLEG